MRRNKQSQENQGAGVPQDPQLTYAVKLAVEQTLREMGVEANAPSQRKPENEPKTIDLIGLMFYVLEKFWCVLLAAILCAALMGFRASRSVPTYTATAKLYIVNPESSGIDMLDLQLGTVLTLDYQEVFKTWEVHEMVRQELNLPYTYEMMQQMLTVTNPEDTRILYITVAFPDAQMAADIANAYARAAKEFIISTMKGEMPSDFSIALVPGVGYAASKSRSLIMGFMLGSVLAVGILTLLFVLDERPRTPEDISDYGGIPTLAVLPSTKDMRKAARREEKRQAERNITI
ncbi:MAG: hypothetical protein J6M47_06430 [Clostridia bacterium]|nr:hypothetical protein [Clostridia bacterium]